MITDHSLVVEKAQFWCVSCEEFCFETDEESLAAFCDEHLPHALGVKKPRRGMRLK